MHRSFFWLHSGREIISVVCVDDRLSATDLPNLHMMLLADLGKKVTLRDQGILLWCYLCIAVDHNGKQGITILSQEQYIESTTQCFHMLGTMTETTPSQQGKRLLKAHQPDAHDQEPTSLSQPLASLMFIHVHCTLHSSRYHHADSRCISNGCSKRDVEVPSWMHTGTKSFELTYPSHCSQARDTNPSYGS